MTVTLDLPPDALSRLEAEAQRRGVAIDAVVAELAASCRKSRAASRSASRSSASGSSSDGRSADDVDEMLAEGFGED